MTITGYVDVIERADVACAAVVELILFVCTVSVTRN